MNFWRWRLLLIELLHRRLEHVGFTRHVLLRVGDEFDPVGDATTAHEEDVDDAALRTQLDAEDVAIAKLVRRHLLLPLAHRLHRAHGVAQLRRLLEPLSVGRVEHAGVQLIGQLLVAALEKQPRVGDGHGVLLGAADGGHTRRQAALDVVLETRPRALAGDHLVARSNAKQLVRQAHRPPRELGRQQRTRVDVAVALDGARHQHTRKRLGRGQLQVRIVLVIAQQDVELRLTLLDQVVLERQRLDHRVGDDHLQPGDFVEQRVALGIRTVQAEIAAHTIPQRPRLADIDRLASVVQIQIDARLLRQSLDLFLEIGDRHRLRLGPLSL